MRAESFMKNTGLSRLGNNIVNCLCVFPQCVLTVCFVAGVVSDKPHYLIISTAVLCGYAFSAIIVLFGRITLLSLPQALLEHQNDSIEKARLFLKNAVIFIVVLGVVATASIGYFVKNHRERRFDIPVNDLLKQVEESR